MVMFFYGLFLPRNTVLLYGTPRFKVHQAAEPSPDFCFSSILSAKAS